MKENLKIALLGKLISEKEIISNIRNRKSEFFKESINNGSSLIEEKLKEGWEIEAVLKTKTKLILKKPHDLAFEDKVWSLFALLGFKIMNRDRNFHLPYDKKDENLTKQIFLY